MATVTPTRTLDTKGLMCPMPIVKAKKQFDTLAPGEILEVISTDRGSVLDFQGWAKGFKGAELVEQETRTEGGLELYLHYLRRK